MSNEMKGLLCNEARTIVFNKMLEYLEYKKSLSFLYCTN
jgi:hypothetical protein